MNELTVSVIIPAHNEQANIGSVLARLQEALRSEDIPYEIVVVNDNSTDGTESVVGSFKESDPGIRIVTGDPPAGMGRAVRSGLAEYSGDIAIIYMADGSDQPEDAVSYYRNMQEGYDCVFGSRFIGGSRVTNYPLLKLIANRCVNKMIQLMFWTRHNDLTNAFKAYRRHVIEECRPYRASHFNITIEMSLTALIRGYNISVIPIRWEGRSWGSSNLRLRDMGRRYLVTLLKVFFEKALVHDDVMADLLSYRAARERESLNLGKEVADLKERIDYLEKKVRAMGDGRSEGEMEPDDPGRNA